MSLLLAPHFTNEFGLFCIPRPTECNALELMSFQMGENGQLLMVLS